MTAPDVNGGIRYERLPGKGRRKTSFVEVLATRSTLYLADDHLLSVDCVGVSESYKRFHFRDIQSMAVFHTRKWLFQAGLVLPVLGLFGALSWVYREQPPLFVTFFTVFSLCLIIGVIHLYRGPSCSAWISTALTDEELPSLNRLKQALQVARMVEERVAAVQGVLPMDEQCIAALEASFTPVNGPGSKVAHSAVRLGGGQADPLGGTGAGDDAR